MTGVVRTAPEPRRLAAHPDLAGPEARGRSLTAASAGEQGSAGLDRVPQADAEAFDRMNPACRVKFGFPFIRQVGAMTRMRLERLVTGRGGVFRRIAMRAGTSRRGLRVASAEPVRRIRLPA